MKTDIASEKQVFNEKVTETDVFECQMRCKMKPFRFSTSVLETGDPAAASVSQTTRRWGYWKDHTPGIEAEEVYIPQKLLQQQKVAFERGPQVEKLIQSVPEFLSRVGKEWLQEFQKAPLSLSR